MEPRSVPGSGFNCSDRGSRCACYMAPYGAHHSGISMSQSGGAFLHSRAKAMTNWLTGVTVCGSREKVTGGVSHTLPALQLVARCLTASVLIGLTSPLMRGMQAMRAYSIAAETRAVFGVLYVFCTKSLLRSVRLCWRWYLCVRGEQSMASRSVST